MAPDACSHLRSGEPAVGACCSSDAGERLVGDLTWFRVGLALAFAGQGMVFGLGYNNALLAGEAPAFGSTVYWILHGALFASALAVIGLLGGPLLRSAWVSVCRREVTVEGLFLLTASGALGASLLSSLRGEGSVYYEVVGLVLAIYTVGRKVGARTRGEALAAASHWRESFAWAHLETAAGNRHRVPLGQVVAGARVVVLPGEAIPVDGTIAEGVGEVQETILSGELVPVAKGPGDRVVAGSYAVDARLIIAADDPASGRSLDRILAMLDEAAARPSRLQNEADRLMRWFLPIVVGVSAVTFLGWATLSAEGWQGALFNAMAVLLVACPCALGLATPIAVWTGLLTLSRRGLVSREGEVLDGLADARVWFFDKTGTLSSPVLVLEELEMLPAAAVDEEWLRAAVATLEEGSSHPLAQALVRLSPRRLPLADLRVVPAQGLEGTVEGRRLQVGQPVWVGLGPGPVGRVVGVAVDGHPAARLHLREDIPAASEQALRDLADLGLELRLLTGDPSPARATIGGVRVEAGLSPEGKVGAVEAAVRETPGGGVVFVGDGLNDAAALAAAPVGLALHGGAHLSRASAAGVLMGESLAVLPWAVRFARRLKQRLRGNLVFALCYNLLGMSLAAAGALHPVVAALLMVGSSLVVSWRAAHLAREAEEM
ncbi:MAG: heavy metal translocating P-type ATPase [Opitutales bacterium]